MNRFITEQNIARFQLQLLTSKDENQRKMLLRLRAEEQTWDRQGSEEKK